MNVVTNNTSFNPDVLYTKRPVIEFAPHCFVINQNNVEIFVESIQSYIDRKLANRVHNITFNLTALTNIDIYFVRSIEKLVNNCINENNGLLLKIIVKSNIDKTSLIYDLNKLLKTMVSDAVIRKIIQPDTIIIKKDERTTSNN